MGIFSKLFGKNLTKENNSLVKNDSWEHYSYDYEEDGNNFKTIVEFDVHHSSEQNHSILKNGLRFIIYLNPDCCADNGLAFRDLAIQLLQKQKSLLAQIQSDSRLVAKLSYGFLVEFVFQTNDISLLKKELALFKTSDCLFKVEFSEYSGWQFFDEKIKPDPFFQQKISDRKVIEQLIKHGSNPKAIHTLEHLFLGEKEILEFVADQLKEQGFKLYSLEENSMVLTQEMVLDLEAISNHSGRLKMFADKVGISYDGWGTKIMS